jgi:hypothetical protein
MKTKTIKQKSLIDYYGFSKTEQKNCPVITGILKQLTPKRIEKEIEEIQKIKLPPELQKWVEEYKKVWERNEFFWKFIYRINQTITPFNIPKVYQNSVIKIKFLTVMFIVLIDDIVDKTQNKRLLNKILKIPFYQNYLEFDQFTKKEKEYLKFTKKLWNYINKIIKKYPKYKAFKNIFEYDIKQVLNAMNYAYLVNKNPYLINRTEYLLYSPHTLQGMINCTLDLMCFPKFNVKELSKVREIFWRAQTIVRIGNCLSTWEREFKEGDLTSGIFAYTVSFNLLNINDLNKKNKINIVNKINHSNIKNKLLKECQQNSTEIYYFCKKNKSINYKDFLVKLKKIFSMYLITGEYYK